TYAYLLNFADDRDIINMLSVNKKFRNEGFFERVMKKKYPDLIQYRDEGESWKHLFLRVVYYVSKLKEKYNIPYFHGLDVMNMFGGYINQLNFIADHAATSQILV